MKVRIAIGVFDILMAVANAYLSYGNLVAGNYALAAFQLVMTGALLVLGCTLISKP